MVDSYRDRERERLEREKREKERDSTNRRERESGITSTLTSAISSTKAYFNPFSSNSHGSSSSSSSNHHSSIGQQTDSARLLSEVAPHIMRPRMLNAAIAHANSTSNSNSSSLILGNSSQRSRLNGGYNTFNLSLSHPARSLGRISNSIKSGPITSNELRVLEISDLILTEATLASTIAGSDLDAQESSGPSAGIVKEVSLFRGFQATLPSNLEGKARRRKQRGRDGPKMGLREMGENARGLLVEGAEETEGAFQSKEIRKARRSLANGKKDEIPLGIEELQIQADEIANERENLDIRRVSTSWEGRGRVIEGAMLRVASLFREDALGLPLSA